MKGQTQQVFIYIMVILVVGAILIFGFKSIRNIMNNACEVDKVTFQTDLREIITTSSDYGDDIRYSLDSPCGYERICFIDSIILAMPDNFIDSPVTLESERIRSEVNAKTGNNVFLIKGEEVIPLYSLDMITVNNEQNSNYICINTKSGNFNLHLEGLGRGKVRISEDE